MSTYEIFEILFTDFKYKFEDENCIFTQKYAVDIQQIRFYRLKEISKIDFEKALKDLNDLQEKFAYHKHWSPFFFSKHLRQEMVFDCLN